MKLSKELEAWLEGRPPLIRAMAQKWPPAVYIMKRGAPYGIAISGTPVSLYSYNEDGTVGVIIKAKDKKPAALAHEEYLCLRYHKPPEFLEEVHKKNTLVNVDPTWLGRKVTDGKEEISAATDNRKAPRRVGHAGGGGSRKKNGSPKAQ